MSNAARIEELQKKFDENPRRYFAPLANECRKAGDLDAAIAICRAHLPQQPGHMSGHIVYGQALFEAGQLEEARSVFETALGLDPENLIALRHMGDISARFGDVDGARAWYRRVLDTDPRNEEIQQLLAALGDGEAEVAPTPVAVEGHDLPALLDPALVGAAAEAVIEPEAAIESEAAGEPAVAGLEPTAVEGLEVAGEQEPEGAELLDFEPTSFGGSAPSVEEPQATPTLEIEAPYIGDAAPPLDFEATGFGATGLEPTSLAVPEPPAADAFLTETMAELYLQQGYRDRALEVYRQLVVQNPGDAALRERMERIEQAGPTDAATEFAAEEVEPLDDELSLELPGALKPIEPTAPGLPMGMEPALVAAAAEAALPSTGGGPTIREFLTALATGQPVDLAGVPAQETLPAFTDELPPVLPELDSVAPPEPGGEIAEVVDVATVDREGGLDTLFGPTASDSDLRAAEELAAAFELPEPTGTPERSPLSGRPARPAGTDLSLDHVFGQPRHPGGARPTGSFSFDQFFAEDAIRAPREETPDAQDESAPDDDIEQFNSWLKGLRNQ